MTAMSADPRILARFHPVRAREVVADPPWRPCGFCWGQRQYYMLTAGGQMVGPFTCPACLGLGDVPSVAA